MNGATRELRPILKLREDVGQRDAGFVEDDGGGTLAFRRLHAGLADGDIRLAPLQASLRNRRGLVQRARAALDQLLVVELDPVRRLVLDPIPERLELGTVKNGLPRTYLATLVGILDF